MNRILAAFAGVLALVLLQVPVQAAEIAVGSSDALTTMLTVLGPKFEKASGNKLDMTFDTSNLIKLKASELQNQAAIRDLFKVTRDSAGNLPPMPGVFPDCPAGGAQCKQRT